MGGKKEAEETPTVHAFTSVSTDVKACWRGLGLQEFSLGCRSGVLMSLQNSQDLH